MLRRQKPDITPQVAHKMNEGATTQALANLLIEYCSDRVQALLLDVGRMQDRTPEKKKQITDAIREVIAARLKWLHYDDKKEMLLTLTENKRFGRNTRSREKIIEILHDVMRGLSIWVRYSVKQEKRVLTVGK